jgi:putative DNA primase/helicase
MRPATLFRIVDKWNPALFIDECDTFIKSDDEMPGLINAGHTRDSSTVWRCVGDNHDVTPFDVWGAKALAGIALEKHLPDATLSRAVVFNMRRKLKDERIERLRGGARDSFDVLASKLARFADDHRDAVRAARPDLPDVLGDRDQDNWSTLLAVAEQAGAEWVRRATAAALELSGKADGSQSAGNELLADIQAAFDAKHIDRISTADLIAALLADDEAAWATWNHGKPLTPRQLGRMLKQYGIASKNVRTKYEQAKGFDREQFADVFARYLNPPENQRPNVPNPESPMNTRDSAGLTENAGRVTSVPTSDVGRINPYRDGNKNPSVTLEPAWIKAGDGGTDESPFSGVAESAFFEDDDVEVF